MYLFIRKLFVAAVFLAASAIVLAQDGAADEEFIVIEDLSKAELRAEIAKIENEFYRVFNANIDDPTLMITCAMYTPINSHIQQRACEPKFLVTARNANIQAWQNDVDVLQTPADLRSDLSFEFEKLTSAMNGVLKEVPYFAELNGILRMLRDRMQELDGN